MGDGMDRGRSDGGADEEPMEGVMKKVMGAAMDKKSPAALFRIAGDVDR